MTGAATWTLSGNGKSVSVVFAAGQAVKPWPVAELPLSTTTEFRISGPELASPTTIRISAITSGSGTPDEIASGLIGKGCTAQLDVLVDAGKSVGSSG